MNQTKTKKALVMSVLSMVLCIAMLVGMTFAWFTDTASTSVNKIQAGKLDVALEMWDAKAGTKNDDGTTTGAWVSAEGKTLNFIAKDGRSEILWEPNCTYELPKVRVVNNGNLALKYKVVISGVVGDSNLAEVLELKMNGEFIKDTEENKVTLNDAFTSTDPDGFAHGNLAAGKDSGAISIALHMQETAGNKYQGESISGIAITVLATQDTVEYDSTTDQYDKDATYAKSVSDADELFDAFKSGDSVVLTDDIELTGDVDNESANRKEAHISKDININLNGKTLNLGNKTLLMTTEGATVTISNGKITGNCKNLVWASNGSDLTLTNCEINAPSGHGATARRAVDDTGAYSKLTLNNCTITAQESCVGAMNGGIVVINGGEYTSKDNYVVGTNGTDSYSGNKITINGGTFTGTIETSGYIACGVYMAHDGDEITINDGTFNITNGVGLCARYGDATVADSVIWKITGDNANTGKVGATEPYHAGYTYDGVNGTVNGEKNYN